MNNTEKSFPRMFSALALGVHAFTASAAFVGLLTLLKIHQHEYVQALWLMALAVIIDAVDGTLARLVQVKKVMPKIDGTLLDNIVDYLNYVITPAFFLLVKPDMLPDASSLWIALAITITSAYQFCQADAKTPDHFFKGFPCYWNFAIFYMFIFNTSMWTNAWLLTILCVLIFIPVKYVYPSRLDYLTDSRRLKILMHLCSILYGISSALLLWNYPESHPIWLSISLGYIIMYLILSIYRTYSPMIIAKISAGKD
ncbi:phosphatidylcholine synthase [Legionella londiniensis]|uniref:Phosphatidylcholine synthase n=1 Tax=Legionella londiniensis TaxID=45068 RepID=A0A0W0VMM6_9GAMM|nr:CDP-alcohol phosphatidyltransferase family protein [Legionella londiniensis]KTD21149.1 (CDP-alcohol) phosphatidyltransferase [Legionella londiniensis]STX93171.1 lidK (CDP-alcohol) phosphatidyltransferase [Legionella londiniensis]